MQRSGDKTRAANALIEALERNWRVEMEGAATYRYLAEKESDPRRQSILLKLADGESRHAERWANRLRELGATVPAEPPGHVSWLNQHSTPEATLRRLERTEEEHIVAYKDQARQLNDAPSLAIIREAVRDEASHAQTLHGMTADRGNPKSRLETILKREKWHTSTGSWFGDAIYGANDGLGAVFGIVSGVAGATGAAGSGSNAGHVVLLAGLAGAIASALSMGSGAYLATKSEGEVHQAEIARERHEIDDFPAEEIEELELFYQLKGLSDEESSMLVSRIARDKNKLLQALVQEELGLSEERMPNPLMSALSSSVATFFGAMIPVLPFFFLGGLTAVIVAAFVSLVAHFAVGASKTLVTGRNPFVSGGEMTIVGAVEGVVTYLIGILISPVTA
ncbi:MAG TPA: VIT1/CCC1 transporter family protein [Chloroflexota bacterium]